MKEQPKQSLEAVIHRELRQLPARRAPAALRSRVLATLEARARLPWWQRPWASWPRGGRLLSITLMSSLVLFFAYATLVAWQSSFAISMVTRAEMVIAPFAPVWETVLSVANALFLVLRSLDPIYLMAATSVVLLSSLSCLGLGTVCYRFVLRPR